MTCETVELPDGTRAIVCGGRKRHRQRCSSCGLKCDYLCDWKVGGGKTCDVPICGIHALEVAANKHLCPDHQRAYREWLDARGAAP